MTTRCRKSFALAMHPLAVIFFNLEVLTQHCRWKLQPNREQNYLSELFLCDVLTRYCHTIYLNCEFGKKKQQRQQRFSFIIKSNKLSLWQNFQMFFRIKFFFHSHLVIVYLFVSIQGGFVRNTKCAACNFLVHIYTSIPYYIFIFTLQKNSLYVFVQLFATNKSSHIKSFSTKFYHEREVKEKSSNDDSKRRQMSLLALLFLLSTVYFRFDLCWIPFFFSRKRLDFKLIKKFMV